MSKPNTYMDILIEAAEDKYDPDALVDVLNITIRELVEAFPDRFLDKLDELGLDIEHYDYD